MASTMLALAPDSTQMESLALVTLTNVELLYQMTLASTLTVRTCNRMRQSAVP